MELTLCPVKVPVKGRKIINIGGIQFFVREANRLVQIYLQDTGELILVSGNSKDVAVRQLIERIDDVRRYIDSRGAGKL